MTAQKKSAAPKTGKAKSDKTTEAPQADKMQKDKNTMFGFETLNGFFEKAPQVDVKSVMDFQRKNVEAMVEVNRVFFDTAKEMAAKQADFAKDMAAELNEKAMKGFQVEKPEFDLNKQVEDFQAAMKTVGENAKSVADMSADAGQKALAIVQERYTASVEEIKAAAK